MDLGLDGRVALVIGASAGLGRAIAAELVREGARVAIASRSRERIDAAAAELGAAPFVWDTEDVDGAPGLVEAVTDALGGPVEVLVANTGGPPVGADPLGFTTAEWEAAYRSLVRAPLALIEAVLPAMRERRWGRVVNVASTSIREPIPALMLSNVHRAGMGTAFKTLARHVAGDGVTMNTLLPGSFATDRVFAADEDAEATARSDVPVGRLGRPEELAAVAAFLCSVRAGYLTGEVVTVDGGRTRSVF